MNPLPYIASLLTLHPRHAVGIVTWSKTSWTYNAFRVWELLFWRKCGKNGIGDTIRYESTLSTFHNAATGETISIRDFGTYESLIVHIESAIRGYFTLPKISFKFVPIPQFAYAHGYQDNKRSIYRFAIAFDSAQIKFDNGGTLTSFSTANLTCTGSNLLLAVNIYMDTQIATSITDVQYNSSSFGTVITSVAGSFATSYIYAKVAPVSGSALPVVVTTSGVVQGNKQIGIVAQSYSGCAQTAQPHKFGTNNTVTDTTTNFPVTVTGITLVNCWLVGGAQSDFQGSIGIANAAGSGTTYRGTLAGNMFGADSNGTVGTGSQTLNWTKTTLSDYCTGCAMAIAPFIAGAVTYFGSKLPPRAFAPRRAR